MSDAKSDWITQLRTALAWAERFPHARMGIETRPILDAARLLASGRRPDVGRASNVLRKYRHTDMGSGELTELILEAALGGSDVLIVDMGEEAHDA